MAEQSISICANPIFVIGSPRSGTSAFAWALAQHSQLWASSESDFLMHLFGNGHLEAAFRKSNVEGSWLPLQSVKLIELSEYIGYGINALFTSRSQGRRWVEQSPSYTEMLPLIQVMFPRAQFIHVLRDGRRVVNSMLKSKINELWARDFRAACQTWSFSVVTAMTFERERPDRCLTIRNEGALRNPHEVMRTICDFLSLPFEEGPENFLATNVINSSFRPDSAGADLPASLLAGNPWEHWTEDQRVIFLEEAADALEIGEIDSSAWG